MAGRLRLARGGSHAGPIVAVPDATGPCRRCDRGPGPRDCRVPWQVDGRHRNVRRLSFVPATSGRPEPEAFSGPLPRSPGAGRGSATSRARSPGRAGQLEGDAAGGSGGGIDGHGHETRDRVLRLRPMPVKSRASHGVRRAARPGDQIEQMFYHWPPLPEICPVAHSAYAELHCHSHFSFLDGASAPDDLVDRAVEMGLTGLAVTDSQGLYGAVRFSTAAEAAGLHPVIGIEIELLDAAVPDPSGIVVPARRAWRPGRRPPTALADRRVTDGRPVRPRPERTRLPGASDGQEGGSPGHRAGTAWPASRVARAGCDGLAEPVPAGVPREPRRLQGRSVVHACPAGGPRGGADRALRLPPRRAGQTAPGR